MQQKSAPSRTCSLLVRLLPAIALASATLFALPVTSNGQAPPASAAKSFVVRLVNITIPPDSPLRKSEKINTPPCLYIELFEDGTRIGMSTAETGWESDFPEVAKNQWTIKGSSKTRYLVKVWDSNWLGDDLAFEISGCKSADLKGVVRERGSASSSTDRLSSVEFEVVESTVPADRPAVKP